MQRKLLKGMCTMVVLKLFCSMLTLLTQLCIECITLNCIHVETVDTTAHNVLYSIVFMSALSIHAFSAVRTVAAGHRMVAEGWTLFEKTCKEVLPGELPQLLRQFKSVTTPFPGPSTPITPVKTTPVKTEPMEEEGEVHQLADSGVSRFIEMPKMIKLGPQHHQYRCGNCNISWRSKYAKDAHIHIAHTKKALLCSFCHFSTYNIDSLQRHEKEHK